MKTNITMLLAVLFISAAVVAQDDNQAKEDLRKAREEMHYNERKMREQERMQRMQTRAAGKQQIFCLVTEEKDMTSGKVTVQVSMGSGEFVKETKSRDLTDEKTKKPVKFTNYLDALGYLSARKWSVSSTSAYQTNKALVRECLMSKPMPPPTAVTSTKQD